MPPTARTLRVPVCLHPSGGDSVAGILCLSPWSEFHAGPETLLERLNATERMLAVEDPDGGPTLLVTRRDVERVVPHHDVSPNVVGPRMFRVTREERVRVSLRSGTELEGRVFLELPDRMNRISDFVNGPDDFFALATAAGTVLVNKDRVRAIALYEGSPVRSETG